MYRATGQQVYTFLLSILSYFEFHDNNRIFCLHDSLLSTTSRYTNILYISSLFVSLITLQKQVNTHNHRNSISSSRVQSIERFILFPPRSKNPAFLSPNYSSLSSLPYYTQPRATTAWATTHLTQFVGCQNLSPNGRSLPSNGRRGGGRRRGRRSGRN